MITLKDIETYMKDIFGDLYLDEPHSLNGIQVRGKEEIKKIGFAVDANMYLFEKDCDLFIVHHGIIWKKEGVLPIEGIYKKRIQKLLNDNKSLIGLHLPLDAHPILGNNIQFMKLCGFEEITKQNDFFYTGILKNNFSQEEFNAFIEDKLSTSITSFYFNKTIKKIGFCSGGGGFHIKEAIEQGCDTFITGEQNHSIYHIARESSINLIFAGHYATETLGIKALMEDMKHKYDVNCIYYEDQTGL